MEGRMTEAARLAIVLLLTALAYATGAAIGA